MLSKKTFSTINIAAVQKLRNERHYLPRTYSNIAARRRVVVTGIGIVSPIGCSTEAAWKSVLNGTCGIRKLEGQAYDGLPCRIAAKITEDDLKLTDHFSTSELKPLAPASAYALIAGNSIYLNILEPSFGAVIAHLVPS